MSNQSEAVVGSNEQSPWKRIAGKEIGSRSENTQSNSAGPIESQTPSLIRRVLAYLQNTVSNLFIHVVHKVSRSINKPMVDIGREYSVSDLNSRINTLEEILIRQWSQLPDSEIMSPKDEVKLYVAACHVARQYDRITSSLLATRLGVSQNRAELLLEQLMGDEVITESYTVTYHDVRKAMVEATIERQLHDARTIIKNESDESPSAKKH